MSQVKPPSGTKENEDGRRLDDEYRQDLAAIRYVEGLPHIEAGKIELCVAVLICIALTVAVTLWLYGFLNAGAVTVDRPFECLANCD